MVPWTPVCYATRGNTDKEEEGESGKEKKWVITEDFTWPNSLPNMVYKILIELTHLHSSSSLHVALFVKAPVGCHLDCWEASLVSISFPNRVFRSCKAFVLRITFLVTCSSPQVALIMGIDLILGEAYTVEWDLKIMDAEKIDCFPDESGASAENCSARGCVWEVTMPTTLVCIKILDTQPVVSWVYHQCHYLKPIERKDFQRNLSLYLDVKNR